MVFLSDINIKAYDVDKEGNIREWIFDAENFTFETTAFEYSANHMDDEAVVVKVSPVIDENGINIEEGQIIVDVYGIEYEVKYDELNGFIVDNGDMRKSLQDVLSPKIVRKYPEQIIELAKEITSELELATKMIFSCKVDIEISIDEDALKKEAKAKKAPLTSFRKKILHMIDWELVISFGLKSEPKKVLGVYKNGIYRVKGVELKDASEEDAIEFYDNVKENCPFIKKILFKRNSND